MIGQEYSTYKKDCKHDYDKPIRKGRAHYVCPKCGKDITMDLLFIAEAKEE